MSTRVSRHGGLKRIRFARRLGSLQSLMPVVPAGRHSPGFREYIAQPAQTHILTYIHISGIGLVYGPVGEMHELEYAHPEKVADTLMQNRDITVGVKVRQGKSQVGDNGVEPLKLAIRAAEIANTSVMVHIGTGVPLPRCAKTDAPRRCCHPLLSGKRRLYR